MLQFSRLINIILPSFFWLQNSKASDFQASNIISTGPLGPFNVPCAETVSGTRFLKEIQRKSGRMVYPRAPGLSWRALEVGAGAFDEYYFGFNFFWLQNSLASNFFAFKILWLQIFKASNLFGFKFSFFKFSFFKF